MGDNRCERTYEDIYLKQMRSMKFIDNRKYNQIMKIELMIIIKKC